MVIPTIVSRVSKISRDKGNKIRIVFNPRHSGSTLIKIFVECVGAIMGIQVPLMVIDQRGVSIMSACSRTRRVTHLTFVDARVVMGYFFGDETEGCSESQMGSRTSRGAPEWSGDKISYKASCILGTGKVQEFSGRFWKLLEFLGKLGKVAEGSGGGGASNMGHIVGAHGLLAELPPPPSPT